MKFKTLKPFRDREGKDMDKLTEKQKSALSVYSKNKPYESENKEWTDYLVEEGFIESVEESSSPVPKPAPKKRTTRKKASE